MKKLKTVLLIDDDEISSYLNHQLLEELGIIDSIVCLTNGQEALDYLKIAYASQGKGGFVVPDLILLDLNMPGLDGFQVLDQLNEMCGSEGLVFNRIIILSTSMHPVDQERAGNYDVFDYLVKPLTETKIKGVIDHFLQSQVPDSNNQNKIADPEKVKHRPPVKKAETERVKKPKNKTGKS